MKVTEKTIKSYIDDAAKYNRSTIAKEGSEVTTEKVILHVEKKGNLSEEVLRHAKEKRVEIVDDISTVLN